MQPNNQAQAVLLLTTLFGKSNGTSAKPLSIKEWARFARSLKERGLQPSSLLKGDLNSLLRDWKDQTITLSRLEKFAWPGRGAEPCL